MSLVERARETGAIGTQDPVEVRQAPASTAPVSKAPASTPMPAAVAGQPSPALFKDCAGRRVDPANEFIGCPTFMASVHRPVGYTVDAALATLVEDARHSAYGDGDRRTVSERDYRFQLDDRLLPGRRYTVKFKGTEATDHHVAVALEGRGGKLLLAHCQTNGQLGQSPVAIDDACRSALATILTGQIPASIYLAKAPYADGTLGGRTLKTPAGCERDGTLQRIRCGEGGQLSWYQAKTSLVPLAVVARAKTQAITSSAEADGVTLAKPDAVPCTVAGESTTCIHHRLDIKGEPSVHFYQAKVGLENDTLYAVCSGAGADPKSAVPKPCDQVFAW